MINPNHFPMKRYRKNQIKTSNNPNNPNKNVCALRVAQALCVEDNVRYLHNIDDLLRAVRKKWTARSRYSKVKGKTVGAAREKLSQIANKLSNEKGVNVAGFILRVVVKNEGGHAMLMETDGSTLIDTSPVKRDVRDITHCYVVYTNFDILTTTKTHE